MGISLLNTLPKRREVPKETPVAEVVMDSGGDTFDEEIEMETCDAHRMSGKNKEDVINAD